MSAFRKATKHQAKARIAIAGPAGSGKTFTALTLATHIADGPIAVVDTEHGSAEKYADRFAFDVLTMDAPFHPDRFVEAIRAAAKGGYTTLILDSLSHAWNGSGGLLEIVDEIAKRTKSVNSFAAWKDATPIQNRMVEALLSAPIHIIATMRSKQEYVIEQVERNGRTVNVPRKVGMAPIQRDAFEYEFDIFAEMDADNNMIITKTRCSELSGRVIARPGADVAGVIRNWLGTGEPSPARPVAPDSPSENGKPTTTRGATAEQVKLLGKLIKSHVFKDREREAVLAEMEAGLTKVRATELIELTKETLENRKANEKAAAAATTGESE